VTLVQNLGSPTQQLAVIEQTASWAIRHDFPTDESLAVLHLGNTANDLQATFRLEPMIQAYLQSDSLVLEILHAAIWPARRMKIPELSRSLIHGVMSVVHAKGEWPEPRRDLVRRVAELATPNLDEATRAALGGMIIATLEEVSERIKRVKLLRQRSLLRL
jgi:hypothetical protein